MTYNIQGKKIFVAGHAGLVGQSVCRQLKTKNCQVLTIGRRSLDLTRQADVDKWMQDNKPDIVIICAAKVGGIHANQTYSANFLYDNIMIQTNLIHAAYKTAVEKLLFLGSSCIYPKNSFQPIQEEYLLTGSLEPTNEAYAIAKIAGLKMCQAYRKQYGCNFITAMPTNLYGPADNFHPLNSHVPAALLRRFHEAKLSQSPSVTIWGNGQARREFLFVDDLAKALLFLLENYSSAEPINIGSGLDISINEFAKLVSKTVGYKGAIEHDLSRKNGMALKCLDVSKINNLGWKSLTSLEDGLKVTYEWYKGNLNRLRAA